MIYSEENSCRPFRLFNAFLCFRAESAKKQVSAICHIQFQGKVIEQFRNRIKKLWSVRTKIAVLLRKYFESKNWRTRFCCLCVNLPTVKIWGQSVKFPMSFSFLQCLLQVKKIDLRKQR